MELWRAVAIGAAALRILTPGCQFLSAFTLVLEMGDAEAHLVSWLHRLFGAAVVSSCIRRDLDLVIGLMEDVAAVAAAESPCNVAL